jgi:hypothetical protein
MRIADRSTPVKVLSLRIFIRIRALANTCDSKIGTMIEALVKVMDTLYTLRHFATSCAVNPPIRYATLVFFSAYGVARLIPSAGDSTIFLESNSCLENN